ncbi:MAG: hypothetical protein ABI378_07275 [Chitinophagaceae bacterium]
MEDNIERFWHRVYFKLELGYIEACIERAYRDLCRTLRVQGYDEGVWKQYQIELTDILKLNILEMLAEKMTSQEEFDVWHHRTMLRLISNDNIENLVAKSTLLTIGQGQKWINMALKCIYAVGERYIPNAWANYTYFHVPIDSIIQERFAKHGIKKLEMPWSRLDEVARYEIYQRECRSTFPKEILIEIEMELFNQSSRD